MPRAGHFPPRLSAFVVQAPRSHGRARRAVEIRLMRVAVKNKSVHAHAKFKIAERLDVGGRGFPHFLVAGGERLRAENRVAINVRDGRRLLRPRIGVTSAEFVAGPKFRHRFVGAGGVGVFVAERQRVTFQRIAQSMRLRQLFNLPGIIFREQFGNRLVKIPAKTCGGFGVIENV